MRRFYFDRQTDVSGTSGTGAVVEGVQFSDGSIAVHWMTALSSWSLYRSIEECVAIHGHEGSTALVWVDEAPSDPAYYASANVSWFKVPDGKRWHRAGTRMFDDTDGEGRMHVTRAMALCGVVAWSGSAFMGQPGAAGACATCQRELDKRGPA